MAKPRNSGNLNHNDTCKREDPTRTEVIDFQCEAQQALCDIQAALARLPMNPNVNHDNDRICNNDGALAQPVCECVHMLPNRRPTSYENSSNDEDFAEGVFQVFKSVNNYRDRSNCKSRDFHNEIDLPSFNGRLQTRDFLNWLNEVEIFFKHMEIPEKKKVSLVAYKLKGTTLLGGNKQRFQGCGKGRH